MVGRSQAFTLVEVLISTAVLSIGLLGILAVYTYGTIGTRHSSQATQAVNYARELMEAIKVRNLSFAGTAGLLDGDPAISTNRTRLSSDPVFGPTGTNGDINLPKDINMSRNVRYCYLGATTCPGTPMTDWRRNVMQVNVTIFWTDQGYEHSVGLTSLMRQ